MRTITLNEIAGQANVDPKDARQRLRNLGGAVPTKMAAGRWVFKMADRRKVLRLIKR
jgi:hypothetical protein